MRPIASFFTALVALLVAPVIYADEPANETDLTSFDLSFEIEDEPLLPQWLEFSISEQLNLSRLSNSQPAKHQTRISLGTEGSIKTWLYGRLSGDVWIDWPHQSLADTERSELELVAELDRAWLQASTGSVSGKAGLDTIAWGEVEGSGVVDVLNPVTLTPELPMNLTGAPQWWLSGQFYSGSTQFSGFINLQPDYVDLGFEPPETDELEFGTRISLQQTGGDLSIYAAQLLPNTPTVVPGPSPSLIAAPYQLVALSANRAFGNWIVRTELARKTDLTSYRQNMPLPDIAAFDRVDASLAMEYKRGSSQQWLVAVIGQRILEFDPMYGSPTPDLTGWIPADETSGQWLLRFSDRYRNDNLSLTLLSRRSLDNKLWLAMGEVEYRISDPWQVTLSLLHSEVNDQHPLNSYDGEWLAGLSVVWTP